MLLALRLLYESHIVPPPPINTGSAGGYGRRRVQSREQQLAVFGLEALAQVMAAGVLDEEEFLALIQNLA